jgi:photosystem II stability/assembly factor-like uncharacterized protein
MSVATGSIYQIQFSSSTPDTGYAVGLHGLWKTTDGGLSWSVVGNYNAYGFHGIAIDPTNPDIIYIASTLGGMYKSINGGSSVAVINTGIPIDVAVHGVAFASTTSNIVYATVDGNGFYKSTDRGYTWALQSSAYPEVNRSHLIVVDPTNPDVIYAGFERIMKSTDGGVTFTLVLDPPGDQAFLPGAIDPENPSHVIVAEGTTAYETQNGGVSWDPITTLTP